MKNIAIFGSPRSGKSTLSKMIAHKYPNYHIIIGDDIRWTFQHVLPGNNINNKNGSGMEEDLPNFLATLFHRQIERNQGEFNYIIETCDITPAKAQQLFCDDNTTVLFVGTPKLTVDEHFQEIRKFENERDWTATWDDQALREHCEYWINKTREFEKSCQELGLWYVDTSYDRKKVLADTMKTIEQSLGKLSHLNLPKQVTKDQDLL